MFASFSIIVSLAALFSYINHKFIKLPTTIGLLILSLVLASLIILTESFYSSAYIFFCQTLFDIDFKTILLDVMLSFLLFAGAMHVNLKELREQTLPVFLLATLGVAISTIVVGGLVFWLSGAIGYPISLIYCLLFGSLISPTDPIAVLAILKTTKVDSALKMEVEGESLFNDGVGVVVFLAIMGIATTMDGEFGGVEITELLLVEAGGGIIYGLVLAYLFWKILKSVQDDAKLCVMITLSLAMSGYAFASIIHVSGPIAMVVSGLYIGNRIRSIEFTKHSEHIMETIWEMMDDILNAVLFVLIGLTIFILDYHQTYLFLGLIAIPVCLLARYIAVGIPFSVIYSNTNYTHRTILFLTWGGLRGGISVALALSMTDDLVYKDALVFMTYCVVIFSIIAQGLSLNRVVKKLKLSI